MNATLHDQLRLTPEEVNRLSPVTCVVEAAQQQFRVMLQDVVKTGGFTKERYVRYLSMQYHLTKEVQTQFLAAAGNHVLSGRRRLRDFLYNFALEEEPHFGVAEKDLKQLKRKPLPCPLDVRLWWGLFGPLVHERPLIRLGATCVLENLGPGVKDIAKQLLADAKYINEHNSRFITIHFHEALPHGDQIFKALAGVRLSSGEITDLRQGAVFGGILYLRMAGWVFRLDPVQEVFESFIA